MVGVLGADMSKRCRCPVHVCIIERRNLGLEKYTTLLQQGAKLSCRRLPMGKDFRMSNVCAAGRVHSVAHGVIRSLGSKAVFASGW